MIDKAAIIIFPTTKKDKKERGRHWRQNKHLLAQQGDD
jgi:hypothetical protein